MPALCVFMCVSVCVWWECVRYTARDQESAVFWVGWLEQAPVPPDQGRVVIISGQEWTGTGGVSPGIARSGADQKTPWTNGWLSSTSAVGRHFSSTKTRRRKSRHASDTPSGRLGFVGWVAILKMAAIASNSAHGGFWVSISTTVHATLLRGSRQKHLVLLLCFGVSYVLGVQDLSVRIHCYFWFAVFCVCVCVWFWLVVFLCFFNCCCFFAVILCYFVVLLICHCVFFVSN